MTPDNAENHGWITFGLSTPVLQETTLAPSVRQW